MANSEVAWYPFAITDAASRVLVDGKGLPAECCGLAGQIVEISSAMQAIEFNAGAINPTVSHHVVKTSSGHGPYDGGTRSFVSYLRLVARSESLLLHKLRVCLARVRLTFEALCFGAEVTAGLRSQRRKRQADQE
jgi:hypothetical protein